ncbi:Hsp20/alpha crystallin family protein [Candidatus Fermentibacteria bacterium]|nr:Hsp20/alpha crystallin family protein [Candidatus Fermentibacteria bacterium]
MPSGLGAAWSPAVDLYETPDSYILYVDLPGIPRDRIEIRVQQRSVLIRGVRGDPERGRAADRLEIRTGRFEREVDLPGRIDASGASAVMRDGVLRIVLPRESSESVSIDIEGEEQGPEIVEAGNAP